MFQGQESDSSGDIGGVQGLNSNSLRVISSLNAVQTCRVRIAVVSAFAHTVHVNNCT